MAERQLLFRPEEAASVLAISRAKVYQYIATGELASIKLGTSRRIPAADLDAFVQRLRAEQVRDGSELQTTSAAAAA